MSDLRAVYEEFRKRGGIADLANRVKLLFTGNDRVRYLNGQVTANIATATSPSVHRACVTTAKGKLCADVMVSIGPGGILLDADAAVAGTLPARMERYIVADDVTMEDATDSIAILHLPGVSLDDVPESIRSSLAPSNRYGVPGFDFFPPFRKDVGPHWALLATRFPVLDDEILDVIRIERGIPRWGFELDEGTLPAEAGLDRTHIDFHKGCYIGQEVISRIKSVGRVNRQLHGFVPETGSPIARGFRVFSAETPSVELGVITSVTHSFALDRMIALGYLRRDSPVDGLLAASPDAPDAAVKVTLHPLPFIS